MKEILFKNINFIFILKKNNDICEYFILNKYRILNIRLWIINNIQQVVFRH